MPIAVGAALASKLQHSDLAAEGKMPRCRFPFLGMEPPIEGVVPRGDESSPPSGSCPIIFVCENNGYGISVPQWPSPHRSRISQCAAWPMICPYETADGNKAPEALAAAFAQSGRVGPRTGGGPTLLEFKTYRWLGPLDGRSLRIQDTGRGRGMEEKMPDSIYGAGICWKRIWRLKPSLTRSKKRRGPMRMPRRNTLCRARSRIRPVSWTTYSTTQIYLRKEPVSDEYQDHTRMAIHET